MLGERYGLYYTTRDRLSVAVLLVFSGKMLLLLLLLLLSVGKEVDCTSFMMTIRNETSF